VTARIVDVAGFSLTTGHVAHGELRGSATSSAACTRSQFDTASASWSVTASGLLVADRAASATRATTATLAAAATVASPTDISSLLVTGSGTYGAGSITIPGYDQAYKVTVSDATIPGYNAGTGPTPGIVVYMPAPTTPNAAHWMTIRWVVSGVSRRVAHNLTANWHITGQVVEPEESTSTDCILTYTWDTTAHGWYVSSYTGDVQVREHGPDESPNALPLFFSPEARASGSWSTIQAAQVNALEGLPPDVVDYLSGVGVVADVVVDLGSAGYMEQSIRARTMFDPAWDSGINGIWGHPTVTARSWTVTDDAVDGKILLHEIGHAWDDYSLSAAGTPWGVDRDSPHSTQDYETIVVGDPLAAHEVYEYTPTTVTYTAYDTDGVTVVFGITAARTASSFRSENPIVDLYATVPDKPGSYYRSTIGEWTAQCFMLIWADHVTGYDSTERDALVSEIGGSSILADFNDYAVSIGVLPSSW